MSINAHDIPVIMVNLVIYKTHTILVTVYHVCNIDIIYVVI